MIHQNGRKKLNRRSPHRRSMVRNQIVHLITYGFLQTTKPRAKEVQKNVEKVVTLARVGWNFNTVRRIKSLLPYDMPAVEKMIKEIAPRYAGRPGGYTRVISLGTRASDQAPMARLEWV